MMRSILESSGDGGRGIHKHARSRSSLLYCLVGNHNTMNNVCITDITEMSFRKQ